MTHTQHAKDTQPLVSVYIPTKDRPALLARAVNSVLDQTYENIEILISDDGSKNETPDILSQIKNHKKRIIYIRSDSTRGACHARNKALLHATGEFITGLDDDDCFTPERIERFVNAWKPGISFLCSLYYMDDGIKLTPSHYYKRRISFNDQLRRNHIGSQIFTKREYLIKNRIFFDEMYPAWQDQDLFTRLLLSLGHAERVYCRTYICHVNHGHDRITNPKNTLRGYRLYKKRFEAYMSRSQRISLIVNTNLQRRHRMSNRRLWMCIRAGNFWDFLRILNSRVKRKGIRG